ncbi:MAG: excinuclease ABC subunit UvrA [Verrucomicrobia bacterium]|nr:excinuclease ABC subunit UvrA [Verrucomicrobiota bacterium]
MRILETGSGSSAGEIGEDLRRAAAIQEFHFSAGLHCARCDVDYREPVPALFSFNHPLGACPACKGFGRIIGIDYDLAIPDRSLSLAEGAVKPWRTGFSAECQRDLAKFCRALGVPMNIPFAWLSAEHQRWVIEGDPDYGVDEEHQWPRAWYGVKGYFRWLESKAYKMHVRVLLSRYRAYTTCPQCQGRRFNPDALLFRCPVPAGALATLSSAPGALTLADFYALPIRDALAVVEAWRHERAAARRSPSAGPDPLALVLEEVRSRLGFLAEVGLGYLTLDRPTRTLSGGETERVNLTTCLGSRLVNTLFVLDEPSVGLHPRDTDRLVRILQRLRDAGNTVVVVEHEAAVIRAADQVLDLGPGHGESGGHLVFQGSLAALRRHPASLTGQYLSGRKRIESPARRPVAMGASVTTDAPRWLTLSGITKNNLLNLSVELPLGRFICVTGVSGSGKSTLVRDVLFPAVQAALGTGPAGSSPADVPAGSEAVGENEAPRPLANVTLRGHDALARVVLVDQSALGKTPRSNPAVYVGAFDDLRELFAASETARQRGLKASAFSFNSAQGQCERCRGAGFEKVEMQFLSDVLIRCPDCGGRRYREHILEVKIAPPPDGNRAAAHWSVGDLLEATIDDALAWLAGFGVSRPARRAVAKLALLREIGLAYLRLGQPINTLSGGECQRLKLAAHLAGATATGGESTGLDTVVSHSTLFLFDEPTTGLHFEDVRVLVLALQRLVDAGHSVVVVEHNLDLIRCADWVIDLGPEAGDAGGQIVVAGTPEDVAACPASHTGAALRQAPRVTPDPAVKSASNSSGAGARC